MDAPEDRGVAERHAVAQAASECLLQELAFIDVAEYLRHRLVRDVAIDPERFDVPDHARTAAMFDAQLRPCAGNRRAAVVDRLFFAKTRHRGVDLVWVEFATRQSVADLSFGELAAGEERQAGDVRLLCASGHQGVTGVSGAMCSVISMAVPHGSTT